MNIFYLDTDPTQAARWLCDKHIVKMGLEAVTMLEAAHTIMNGRYASWGNHPCSRWTRASVVNYQWLWVHAMSIFIEYHYRYDRTHSYVANRRIQPLEEPPCGPWRSIELTAPHLAMPEACFVTVNGLVDPVLSYREYYKLKYHTIDCRWRKREFPEWLVEDQCSH